MLSDSMNTYLSLRRAVGFKHQASSSVPRLHDLRHRFAVKSLETCPDTRDRITRHMLALSTYLGHARMESTYWYLESTPLLMTDIARCANHS